uniref:Protein FAR1-RELATED SEQUENCE n=1 Tax=Cannabis sativa TaxID=3483 RepID=A0A803NUB1_CANSA
MLLPPSLIFKRWTNDVKLTTLTTSNEVGSTEQDELIQMVRYGSLNSDTNLLNFYASKLDNSFAYVKNEIARLTAYCKNAFDQTSSNQDGQASESSRGHQDNPNIVRDPINVKTKGMGN